MDKNALTYGVFAVLIALFAWSANDFKFPGAAPRPEGVQWCEAHDAALDECEVCNPVLARGGTVITATAEPQEGVCPNTQRQIALADKAAEQAGLVLADAELVPIDERLSANAETGFIPDRYARVAPRLPGVVHALEAAIGQEVSEGDTLALLHSAELGQAKSDYLQALAVQEMARKNLERNQALFEKRISTEGDLIAAETESARARLEADRAAQRLVTYGLDPKNVNDASPLLSVKSPFTGAVVDLWAVPGETASPDRPLFGIADMDRLWLTMDVYEQDLSRVQVGQRVWFLADGMPGMRFPGQVAAVAGRVDDRARTVPVFAEIKNVRGALRANMFGRAEIRIREIEPKLVVPIDAVQNDGDCNLVFTSPIENVFQARKVELGTRYENGIEITGGLRAGERIVTTGSFLLKTEVLRGQLGAG